MTRTARLLAASVLLLAILGGGLGWLCLHRTGSRSPVRSGSASAPGGRGEGRRPVLVETVRPKREDLKRVSDPGPAQLLPFEETAIRAKASGFLKTVTVDIGDRLKRGEVLAEVQVPEMVQELEEKNQMLEQAQARVDQERAAVEGAAMEVRVAEAALALARAATLRAEADHQLRRKEYERLKALAEESTINKAIVEEKHFQLDSADAARKEAEARIQAAEASRLAVEAKVGKALADLKSAGAGVGVARAAASRAAALLEYATVRAPYDCFILERNVHTGAYLDARADGPLLFRVARTDVLRVVVDIPEKDAPYLRRGDSVKVVLDGFPGETFHWAISRFAPSLGEGKKVRAEMQVENADGRLLPGMYGRASVVLGERLQVLTLPMACLGTDAQGYFVYVVDGRTRRQAVRIGLTDGMMAEITDGLAGTEEVVSSGTGGLVEGQTVAVKGREKPR
jgi:HlyD family secretion protein